MLVSLNSARNKAKETSIKSSISSTVPAAILCMNDGNNINTPIPGTVICNGSRATWPELNTIGSWGVLIDGNVSDGSFEYTATYGDGAKQVSCTKFGCEFPSEEYSY